MSKIKGLGTYGTFAHHILMAQSANLLKTLRNTFGTYGSLKGEDLRASMCAHKPFRSLGGATCAERMTS